MFNKVKVSKHVTKSHSSIGHTPKHKRHYRLGISASNPKLLFDSDDEESFLLENRESIDNLLPHLNDQEAFFLNLVEVGNLKRIKLFLTTEKNFNINCKNYQGYTALILAIKNEDIDTIKYFLQWENLEIGEAFLHAVETGNLQIVQAFVKGCEVVESRKQVEFKSSDVKSTAFSPHTTPLMLAAHQGHYEIIRYLLGRGHSIQHPHTYQCLCPKCQDYIKNETISDALLRLNIYRAIAHPHYICQSSNDPILTAFELCTELRQLALIDREFSKDFLELAEQSSKFAVDLLDQCRNSQEVEVVIHRRAGNKRAQFKPGYRFTRVGLAIQHDQKDFVSHSSCQQVLRNAWLEGFPRWKRLSGFHRFIRVATRILMLPFMIIAYMFASRVSFVKSYFNSPMQKYLNHTLAYIMFMTLLMWQTIIDSQKDERGPPKTGLEPGIIIFVISFFVGNIKTLILKGFRSYTEHLWNIYDLVLYIVFMTSFAVWTWCKYDLQGKTHIIHESRKYWKTDEPTLIGESIYSIGIVLAFLRIIFFYQILPGIGPLQLSFSRLLTDIIRFFLIFFTVLVAFAFGLFTLYHNYGGMRRTQDGEVVKQKDAFITIEATLASLYWCLYGYGGPENAHVVLEAYLEKQGDESVIMFNHHHLTELVGGTIFAIYHIAAIVILLNMLIAMMTQSLERIDENADVEWKFNRTRVWMSYLQKGRALPEPFNLIPTSESMFTAMKWLVCRCRGDPSAKCNGVVCCYLEYEEQTLEQKRREDEHFAEVMAFLIQRYLTSTDNIKEDLTATKEDVESVRHYLRDLREMLVDNFDMKDPSSIPSVKVQDQTSDSVFLHGHRPKTPKK